MNGLYPIIRRKRRSPEAEAAASAELAALRGEVAALKAENQRLVAQLATAQKQLSSLRERR